MSDLLSSTLGDLPNIVYQQSKPSFVSAYSYGLRILSLIFGWFVVLFVFERAIAVLLWGIRFVVRKALGKSKKDISNEVKDGDMLEKTDILSKKRN